MRQLLAAWALAAHAASVALWRIDLAATMALARRGHARPATVDALAARFREQRRRIADRRAARLLRLTRPDVGRRR